MHTDDLERGPGAEPQTPSTSHPECDLRVGCALLPKKVARYLTPAMVQEAARHGVELVLINPDVPLEAQGPFNGIIHKLPPNKAWEHNLVQYVSEHPHVKVIDRLDGIRTLQNRATMLSPLQEDGILLQQPRGGGGGAAAGQQPKRARVQAPLQVEILEGTSEEEAQRLLEQAGLSPPLLCKPLWTDGREGSHGLAVLHDLEALGKLLRGAVSAEFRPPLVVQKFIEHGGVLYKVYVLGHQTVVMCRPSLGDGHLDTEEGVQTLPRISCVSVYSKQRRHRQQQQPSHQQQQQQPQQQLVPAAEPGSLAEAAVWQPPPGSTTCWPPEWVTTGLAATLRKRLGMELFNFDLICPEGEDEQPGNGADTVYMVVDINYFPGVDKIPNFTDRFIEFLRDVCDDASAQPSSTAPSSRCSSHCSSRCSSDHGEEASPVSSGGEAGDVALGVAAAGAAAASANAAKDSGCLLGAAS